MVTGDEIGIGIFVVVVTVVGEVTDTKWLIEWSKFSENHFDLPKLGETADGNIINTDGGGGSSE